MLWDQRKAGDGEAVEMAPSPPQGYLVIRQPKIGTDNRLSFHDVDISGKIDP